MLLEFDAIETSAATDARPGEATLPDGARSDGAPTIDAALAGDGARDAALPDAASPCVLAGGVVEPTTGDCFVALHDRLRTFDEAGAGCEARGGALASLRTAEEQATAAGVLGAGSLHWLGLSDRAAEGSFTWSDGAPVTFTAWQAGEPNDSGAGEDCVMLGYGFTPGLSSWNDTICDAELYTLCRLTPAGGVR